MKLESTLDRRPALLHLAPVLDVVGLMLFFFVLAGSLLSPGGMEVELPLSTSQLPPLTSSHVVLITAGDPPQVLLDRVEISYEALLALLRERPEGAREAVYLKMDRRLPSGLTVEVVDTALGGGYRVFQATTGEGGRRRVGDDVPGTGGEVGAPGERGAPTSPGAPDGKLPQAGAGP